MQSNGIGRRGEPAADAKLGFDCYVWRTGGGSESTSSLTSLLLVSCLVLISIGGGIGLSDFPSGFAELSQPMITSEVWIPLEGRYHRVVVMTALE